MQFCYSWVCYSSGYVAIILNLLGWLVLKTLNPKERICVSIWRPWLIYSLFLSVFDAQFPLTNVAADLGVSLIEKCCDIGVSWATENRGQCPPFSRSDLPVTAEETENCKSVVDLCCLQEAESQQCDKGNDVARERGTCSSLRVYRSNTDSFVHTKVSLISSSSGLQGRTAARLKFPAEPLVNHFLG